MLQIINILKLYEKFLLRPTL